MRFQQSYETIFKESNAYDRRLQAYLTGVDVLLEADKIKQDVFNYEHDFWGF
jgi:Gliding motility associated protein GldN